MIRFTYAAYHCTIYEQWRKAHCKCYVVRRGERVESSTIYFKYDSPSNKYTLLHCKGIWNNPNFVELQ